MASGDFLFLNTTGPPKFSQATANRVRGHVTKVNFANRRRLRNQAETQRLKTTAPRMQSRTPSSATGSQISCSSLATALSVATLRSDGKHAAELLNAFWPIVFLHDRSLSGGENNQLWLEALASEPAFVEATVATAIRFWLPDSICKMRSDFHSYRATSMVRKRLLSDEICSDGFFGAVITMAISERFLRNDAAWKIHMDGLVQVITARQARGIESIPSLFTDLTILDTVNDAIGFPRVYRPNLIQALGKHEGGIILETATLAQNVKTLRRMVSSCRAHGCSDAEAEAISELSDSIHRSAMVLGSNANAYVRSTVRANRLLSSLCWPLQVDEEACALLADELKEEMSNLPGRSCLLMDLTSCELIVGTVASAPGSDSRAWFVSRLKRAVEGLRRRGWDNPAGLLEAALSYDKDLREQFANSCTKISGHL